MIGGGFGVGGALGGMALASLFNTLTTRTYEVVDKTIYIRAEVSELLMRHQSLPPDTLRKPAQRSAEALPQPRRASMPSPGP